MTLLEQKVDAIARIILSAEPTAHDAAMAELAGLMQKHERSTLGVEAVTRSLMLELGIPEHIVGSRYVIKAICMVVENEDLLRSITKELYPAVATLYGTTCARVERGIRHAIEVAWDRGDLDTLQGYFGYTVSISKGKPTNSEFIARCANVVRERIGNYAV